MMGRTKPQKSKCHVEEDNFPDGDTDDVSPDSDDDNDVRFNSVDGDGIASIVKQVKNPLVDCDKL